MNRILETRNLNKDFHFRGSTLSILKDVNLEVDGGEVIAIVGPSGIGKTTLLQIVGLLDRPTSGDIILDGKPVTRLSSRETARKRNAEIGFVFQFYHLLPEFNALENVMIPALVKDGGGRWGAKRREMKDRALELLAEVGLSERARHKPVNLAGGERQRVAIARALINRPRLVLCDEPTGNLDVETARGIHELIRELNERHGQTYVIVTHNLGFAKRADRILGFDPSGKLGRYEVLAEEGALSLRLLPPVGESAAGESINHVENLEEINGESLS